MFPDGVMNWFEGVLKHQSTFSNSLFHGEKFTFCVHIQVLDNNRNFLTNELWQTNKIKDKGCEFSVLQCLSK